LQRKKEKKNKGINRKMKIEREIIAEEEREKKQRDK